MSDRPTTGTPPEPEEEDNLFDFAWGKIIGGVAFLGVAWWLHGAFTELETGTTNSFRTNWLVVLSYRSLGHAATIGILALAGVLVLVFGVRQLLRERS